MPTIPSVFRNVRRNDVHQRPFKAYKNYVVNNTDAISRKFGVQKANHKKITAHVGISTYNYPINATDDTNQHVVWKWIDHRYYRYPFDLARCHELTDAMKTEKVYFMTASVITVPYNDVGERIKPGSLTLKSTVTSSTTNKYNASFEITASDDHDGNLRDIHIPTSSMASSSINIS